MTETILQLIAPGGAVETAILALLLAMASVSDVRTRIIPNRLIAAGLAARLVLLAAEAVCIEGDAGFVAGAGGCARAFAVSLARCTASGLCAAVPALLAALTVERVTGGQALGGGDVKLIFMAGTFVTCDTAVAALLAASMLGAFEGVFLRCAHAIRARGEFDSAFPFAPAIALGFLAAILILA